MNYNKKLIELQEDFNENAWNDFHGGDINDSDDFWDYLYQYVDNAVIYYADCDAILENNSDYHYNEHDLFGRPNSLEQAAYACLYDYLVQNHDTVVWTQLEEVLNEAE